MATTMSVQEAHTPEGPAQARVFGITEAQKQALISNLQLEVTERARKLRTQYALQAQSLKTRLEMRINRIPQSMRKRKMQELVEENVTKPKPAPAPTVPVLVRTQPQETVEKPVKTSKPVSKRKSDHIDVTDDKENEPSETSQGLANPKKRTKTTAATANTKASRTASRRGGPTAVLSPRSNNSRTLVRSPVKPANLGTEKTGTSRSATTQSRTASRTTSAQQARGGSARGGSSEPRNSDASNNSASTTIITKPKPSKTTAAAAPRKASKVVSKATAAPRKAAAAAPGRAAGISAGRKAAATGAAGTESTKPVTSAPVSAGGRTLRKRN